MWVGGWMVKEWWVDLYTCNDMSHAYVRVSSTRSACMFLAVLVDRFR